MRRRLLVFGAAILLALVGLAYLLLVWPLRSPHPQATLAQGTLAITGATLFPSPEAPPMEGATLLVRDGRVSALGPEVPIPAGTRLLRCLGCFVTAGFWNAHVHLTEPKWNNSEWASAERLNAQLADMFGSRGFTTVVDVGSDLRSTLPLRRRIESGELLGPAIYTSGPPLYPPNGIPFYLRESLPLPVLWLLPQPSTAEEAARAVERNISQGADLLKLFTGSWVTKGQVLPMPIAVASAAARAAHAHHQLVFSHPSNLAGTLVALASGVDVLAHAPDATEGITEEVLQQLVQHHLAMVPTLKMFATTVTTNPSYLGPIDSLVRTFHALGGQLLFGTDVGYMRDYSTEGEFSALARCGLGAMDVWRMLTTAPAQRFGVTSLKGTLAVGQLGDVVVLEADPRQDVRNFARVRATVRSGNVVYLKPE